METLFEKFSSSMNHMQYDHGLGPLGSVYSNSNQGSKNGGDSVPHGEPSGLVEIENNPSQDKELGGSPGASTEGDFSDVCTGLTTATLKYISEILMEEDLGGKTCMLQDCLALQAAEKPFYEAIGQEYPPLVNQVSNCSNGTDDCCTTSGSVDSSCNSFVAAKSLVDSNWVTSQGKFESSIQTSGIVDSPENTVLAPNPFGQVAESSNFPLNGGYVSNTQSVDSSTTGGSYNVLNGSKGRKSYQIEDSDGLERRRVSKHSATAVTESVPSDMFDDVVLCNCKKKDAIQCLVHGIKNKLEVKEKQNGQPKSSNGKPKRGKKKGKKGELVDLWTLLTVCAQAVASYDQRTANDLLSQIRQHASAYGDGTQRLAHYFAYGLEVRLAGTQTPISTHHSTWVSAADVLQAYRVYISSCPFNRMSFLMANRTLLKVSEKATTLHIIDFGIGYGFQWPCFIHRVSERPGGPPKLRITGIDFPQAGFRPAERVEETGRRLKAYCDRFHVEFQYNAIATKWHTIKLEDLKIDKDEMTVVNSMYRMRHLPDDTVVVSSPRDTVLKLIKSINPYIFIHGVVNGTHNAPFFLPRFKEALFHFSTLFDLLDATVPKEDQGRMVFEREIYGKDAMNVIACEGLERVERPETYKQWHARNQRIGFKQLPLNRNIYTMVKNLVNANYHPDFVIDEDGQWMLQGWKGRTCYALSFWKPVQEQ